MLIPMNVEGGAWEEGFFTSSKVCILIAAAFINAGVVMWLSTLYVGWPAKVLVYLILAFLDQLVIRLFIFEEKYYYRMYQKMKQYEVSTPSVFWNIASMRDTEDGVILVYGDGKVGILIRMERDTITGKTPEFKEIHYDAISDFYKELNLKNLKFIQMNIMEQAGKDPRLQKLDELVIKAENKNIAKIVESQVGYIKKITRATLFESDYFLIYSEDMNRSDSIVSDSIDCIYKLLDGAFIGFSVLSSNDVLELMKEQYGVRYFDYTEATVGMYRNSGVHIAKAFTITGVTYTSGDTDKVGNVENNRLIALASYISRGVIKPGEWTVKDALGGKIRNNTNKNLSSSRNSTVKFDEIIENEKEQVVPISLDDDIFEREADKMSLSEAISEKASDLVDDILYPRVEQGDEIDSSDIDELLGINQEEQSTDNIGSNHKKSRFKGKKVKKDDRHSDIQLEKIDGNISENSQQYKNLENDMINSTEEDDEYIDF